MVEHRRRYRYCLDDRVINIRQQGPVNDYVANTLAGDRVYVNPDDYRFDKEIDDKKYYILRNRI